MREIEAAHENRATVDIALARGRTEPLPERPDPAARRATPSASLAGAPQRDPELGAVDAGGLGVRALGPGAVERRGSRQASRRRRSRRARARPRAARRRRTASARCGPRPGGPRPCARSGSRARPRARRPRAAARRRGRASARPRSWPGARAGSRSRGSITSDRSSGPSDSSLPPTCDRDALAAVEARPRPRPGRAASIAFAASGMRDAEARPERPEVRLHLVVDAAPRPRST